MESARVSGKVFRFLSTMHPSLSKKERARYGEMDAESWAPWTAEIAAEFADLVKRSPRDPSFAKGLAYVAQKGLPDGSTLAPDDLLANLDRLPGAFDSDDGNGFSVSVEGPRRGLVSYRGMPDFSNACIAVVGELSQRFAAAGAVGVAVKHVSPCRLQGGDGCCFELTWNSESTSVAGKRVSVDELFGPRGAAPKAATPPAPAESVRPPSAPPQEPPPAPRPVAAVVAPAPAPAPVAASQASLPSAAAVAAAAADGSSQDLFEQLRSRLLESEAQAQRHAALEAKIQALDSELARVRAEASASVDAANQATVLVQEELAALKSRIRELVGGA